jgi:carbamoyl-phosphate synthase small subunit
MTGCIPVTSATLALEDGTLLSGEAFGAPCDAVFELVFNTSMTGYQEILSDPSYRGQGVLLTTSHVGNVGINLEDDESTRPQVSALVMRAASPVVSNWRASQSLDAWLANAGVPGISGVDTRWLTRKLRDQGTQKAALSTCGTPAEALLDMARGWPGLDGRDMVREVTCPEAYTWLGDAGSVWVSGKSPQNPGCHVVAFDFGIKHNILRHLSAWGAQVSVVPAYTSFDAVQALKPDGVFLSNGPGDPAGLPSIVHTVAQLIDSGLPIFGICLGHQLIGRALGGDTRRLKFGHHSGNHPVQDLRTRAVLVTAQNHNYAVDPASLDPDEVELTHLSLNDHTLEGMRLKRKQVFSVQFHPEASPGPHDAQALFAGFFSMIHSSQTSRPV